MKRTIAFSVATLLIALLGVQGVSRAVTTINIDFAPNVDVTPPNAGSDIYTVDYSGTAAAPDVGTVWNILDAANDNGDGYTFEDVSIGLYDAVDDAVSSYNGLVDSFGNTTTVDISFDAGGSFGISDNAPNLGNVATDAVGMMRDYLIAFDDSSVTLTGLDPNEEVVLYLYGEGDNLSNDRQTAWNANGVTGATSGDAGGAPLTEGMDYIQLASVIADSSGVVTIQYSPNGTPEGPFNGLQLVYGLDDLVVGDANNDGEVDIFDYELIRDGFRDSGALSRLDGDIAGPNSDLFGDGVVDFYDFAAWQSNFPFSPALSAAATAVPEPATSLLALGFVTMLCVGRSRSRG